jgi:hypothetical protein
MTLVFLLGLPAFAQPTASAEPTASSIFSTPMDPQEAKVPKYLFHWTTYKNLQRLAALVEGRNRYRPEFPVPPLAKNNSYLSSYQPHLVGKPALFCWSHPTAAIRCTREIYGDFTYSESGEKIAPPQLITLRIKSDARILVVTLIREGSPNPPVMKNRLVDLSEYQNADLLLVVHYSGIQDFTVPKHEVELREWVVINPQAVVEFSVDPRELPDEVRLEIQRIASGGAVDTLDRLVKAQDPRFSKGPDLIFGLPTETHLKAYLDSSVELPPIFKKRHLDVTPAACRQALSSVPALR